MMDVDSKKQYTILRIKRKRTDEPLDALVVESGARKKKSRGGLNIFQFAQTVEHDAWEDEQRRQALQEEISRLASENQKKDNAEPPTPATTSPDPKPPSPSISRQQKDDTSRHYTIVKHQDDPEPEKQKRRIPTSPPKVISHKDLPPKKSDFKMYDAILSGSESAPIPAFDSEMDKFLPMLTDYLKIHDMSPPGTPSLSSSAAQSSTPIQTLKSEGDYVWDVFYHRPTKLSEWDAIANFGTLTGLPPSITDPNDSDSDTEPEDEADEDSNEEEYYKNDYPDEEDPSDDSDSSDMFHDQSDDEGLALEEDFDENNWRRE